MACCVLHNIARRLGLDDPDPSDEEEEDLDRFRACPRPREQPPPDAPVAEQALGAQRRPRDNFIRRQFGDRRRGAPY